MVKNPPTVRETWVWYLGEEDPLAKDMITHSSILAWEIPWVQEPGRPQSLGWQRVRHDSVTNTHINCVTPSPPARGVTTLPPPAIPLSFRRALKSWVFFFFLFFVFLALCIVCLAHSKCSTSIHWMNEKMFPIYLLKLWSFKNYANSTTYWWVILTLHLDSKTFTLEMRWLKWIFFFFNEKIVSVFKPRGHLLFNKC